MRIVATGGSTAMRRILLALAALLMSLVALSPTAGATSGDTASGFTTSVSASESEDGSSRTMTVTVEVNDGVTPNDGNALPILARMVPLLFTAQWDDRDLGEIRLSWHGTLGANAYQVNWKRSGEDYQSLADIDGTILLPHWDRDTGNVVVNTSAVTLDRLAPGEFYDVRIREFHTDDDNNEYGVSGDWIELRGIDLFGDRTAIPWIEAHSNEHGMAEISWDRPARTPTGYLVTWKQAADEAYPELSAFYALIQSPFDALLNHQLDNRYVYVDGTMTSASISGLADNTEYDVRARALYRSQAEPVTEGPWKQTDFVTTPPQPPPPPPPVRVLDSRCGTTETVQQRHCGVRLVRMYWGYGHPDNVELGWRRPRSAFLLGTPESYTISRQTRAGSDDSYSWTAWIEQATVIHSVFWANHGIEGSLFRHEITPPSCGDSAFQIRPNYNNGGTPTRGILHHVWILDQVPCAAT